MARLNSSSENEGLSLQSQSQAQTNHRSTSSSFSSKLKTYGRRRAKLVEIKGGNTVAVTRELPREEKEKPMHLEAGFKTMDDDKDDEEEDDDRVQEREQDTSVGDVIYEPKASGDTSFDCIMLKPRASGPLDAEDGGKDANGEIEGGEGNDPAVCVSSAAAEAQEKPNQHDHNRGDESAYSQVEEIAVDPKEEVEKAETSSAMPVLKPTKKRGRPSREDKSASSQAEENLADTTEAEKAGASSAEPVLKAPKKRGRPSGSSSSNKVPKTTKTTRPSTGEGESENQNKAKAAFAVVEFLAAGLKRFKDGPLEKALLARWDGYPLVEDLTWEPERNMLEDAPELVQEFYKAWEA